MFPRKGAKAGVSTPCSDVRFRRFCNKASVRRLYTKIFKNGRGGGGGVKKKKQPPPPPPPPPPPFLPVLPL